MLFFLKLEYWAVLEISKFFVQGGGCTCTLSRRFMNEVLSEERQLTKWPGIFQVGIFRVGIFQGAVWWVVIFPVGIFLEPLNLCIIAQKQYHIYDPKYGIYSLKTLKIQEMFNNLVSFRSKIKFWKPENPHRLGKPR